VKPKQGSISLYKLTSIYKNHISYQGPSLQLGKSSATFSAVKVNGFLGDLIKVGQVSTAAPIPHGFDDFTRDPH
jgi:hypothetical protein